MSVPPRAARELGRVSVDVGRCHGFVGAAEGGAAGPPEGVTGAAGKCRGERVARRGRRGAMLICMRRHDGRRRRRRLARTHGPGAAASIVFSARALALSLSSPFFTSSPSRSLASLPHLFIVICRVPLSPTLSSLPTSFYQSLFVYPFRFASSLGYLSPCALTLAYQYPPKKELKHWKKSENYSIDPQPLIIPEFRRPFFTR